MKIIVYNDDAFIKKANTKPGIVRQFRNALRERNIIDDRQKLTSESLDLFNKAVVLHENGFTWNRSFKNAIEKQYNCQYELNETLEQKNNVLLHEILLRISNIEKHLNI